MAQLAFVIVLGGLGAPDEGSVVSHCERESVGRARRGSAEQDCICGAYSGRRVRRRYYGSPWGGADADGSRCNGERRCV